MSRRPSKVHALPHVRVVDPGHRDVYASRVELRAGRRLSRNQGALLGAAIVLALVLFSVVAPFLIGADPNRILPNGLHADGTPHEAFTEFALGTDVMGRDELARLAHGGRTSLIAAFSATAIAMLIGIVVGVVSGYFGGLVDSIAMQAIDVLQSLPFLLIAITVNGVVSHPSLTILIVLLGVLSWTALARVVRAKTIALRQLSFIEAARALGASTPRILLRHVLPNVRGPAIVMGSTMIANIIVVESAMSFLGVGVPPPTSSWGSMLNESMELLTLSPRLCLLPGGAILLAVFGFSLFGEGLRDAFDPKG